MQKIKSEGCTFYYNDDPSCFDIDVEPGMETVTLGIENTICTIELMYCQKTFPDVKRLVINSSVILIKIPNRMFPNVREVVSHSFHFLSGKYLVSRRFYNSDTRPDTLQNSFCLKPDEVLDLKGIKYISTEALDGCEALKVTNTEKIRELSEATFAGSAMNNQPAPKGGCLMAGTLLLKVDETADTLEFPPETTQVIKSINVDRVKCLKVHNLEILYGLKFQSGLKLPGIVVLGKEVEWANTNILYSSALWENVKEIKVEENNVWLAAKDGILYDKKMQTLIKCPGKFSGLCKIPEGVKKINDYAFMGSTVEKIICPNSLKEINRYAFKDCKNLRYIDFGLGIEEIGYKRFDSGMFSGCSVLEQVVIPSQVKTIGSYVFESSGLKQVILNKGLTYIGMFSFADTDIQEVEIPSTVTHMAHGALADIGKVTLKVTSDRLPVGFVGSLVSYSSAWPEDGVDISTENENIFLFRPDGHASTRNIKTVEQLKIFAKKRAKIFADTLIEKGKSETLAKLLTMDYLESDDLDMLLNTATENNDAVIVAMLLDKANELKKERGGLEI